jgi:DNA-binding SARP family transcriptional activator
MTGESFGSPVLWGSHFDTQARQNLRQALTRLRRVLGEDALISGGETVSLQPGVIACDVARFEALIAGDAACPAGHNSTEMSR